MALEAAQPQTTLRDQLAANLEAVITPEPAAPVEVAPAPAGETEAQRTERLRDEKGKFATPEKAVQKPEATKQQGAVPAATPSAPAEPVKPRPAPPSSWKKDYHAHWETLDPKLADYIVQRESEYARGVSTYKSEAEAAKELKEALTPFLPHLQQRGLHPAQFIRNLAQAEQVLSTAEPLAKHQMFLKLMADYHIQPQALFQMLQNPQAYQAMQPAPQPQQDVRMTVQEVLNEERSKQELNNFLSAAPEKYPHYEAVKDEMIALLRSGTAQDLASAYAKAVRLNDDIWTQEQDRLQRERDAANAAKQKEAAAKARAQAISVKSATPMGQVSEGKKDRRSVIAEALDGLEGRV